MCFRDHKNCSYNVLNVQPFCSLNYPFLPPFNSRKRQSTSFFYIIFYCLCAFFPSKLGGLISDICSLDVELYIHNTCFTCFKQLTLFEIQWPEINAVGKEIFMSGVLFLSDNQPMPLCFTELLCRSLYVTHFQIIWGYILPRSKVLWWYYLLLCMPKKWIPFPESDRNETNIWDLYYLYTNSEYSGLSPSEHDTRSFLNWCGIKSITDILSKSISGLQSSAVRACEQFGLV